ncbi:hypothetical protein [Pontibacter anaerobius]|uniref:STAS/SEC14 domain-containing protein n=1 Tax=Pontibacter anaerobius TaxID=2993940 RepID=A0ABT3RCQ6_9BACT|nr:hypothetical protein [Pontibacter anaerobius]MCX2739203.1 hypothetical protein [Pontibacter anaerobius]
MKRTRTELLYRDPSIAIEFNPMDGWMYVNWRGYQNKESVMAGCLKMLDIMKEIACYRILNDNTLVEGQWSSAAKWLADKWFPAMFEARLQQFAWVYSPSTFSRLSTDKTLKLANFPESIKVFDDIAQAKDWLRSQA